jgi:hypothetical protein
VLHTEHLPPDTVLFWRDLSKAGRRIWDGVKSVSSLAYGIDKLPDKHIVHPPAFLALDLTTPRIPVFLTYHLFEAHRKFARPWRLVAKSTRRVHLCPCHTKAHCLHVYLSKTMLPTRRVYRVSWSPSRSWRSMVILQRSLHKRILH